MTLLKFAWGWKKAGGQDMNWDWTKTAWKALRGAMAAGLAVFALGVLEEFKETHELEAAGVPGWMVPLGVMLVGFAVSWFRNRISITKPDLNYVKKLGAVIQPKLQSKTFKAKAVVGSSSG